MAEQFSADIEQAITKHLFGTQEKMFDSAGALKFSALNRKSRDTYNYCDVLETWLGTSLGIYTGTKVSNMNAQVYKWG